VTLSPEPPSRPPRVLFAIGGLERGGSESQLVALLEQIYPDQVRAVVVTLSDAVDPALKARLGALGVVHTVLGGRGPRARRLGPAVVSLARILQRFRPDLAYAWLEEAALVTAPVARAQGLPIAVARRNVSGPYAAWPRPVVAAIARAERMATVVTANSQAVAQESIRRGVAPQRVRLVPNGHPELDALPMPAADGGVRLGYVARFREEKGHLRLLDALDRVQASADWCVDLAGDGPLRERVVAEVRRRGLEGRVRFDGRFEDPRRFWADRHVGVLLSDHEGSPNALIEAAMAGRPIVGTAVGGIPDVVGADGGFVVPVDDATATARVLGRLIDDAALRERTGVAAHRHVSQRFSMQGFVEGHHAAILETIRSTER
jgi:glycosyltransferase involved in cell wall biosynthesis